MNESLLTTVCRRMPTFKNPIYSKQANAKKEVVASYVFPIDYDDEEGICFTVEAIENISISSVEVCLKENTEWWNEFIQDFLMQSAKYFSKQYTVQDIQKVIRHTMDPVIECAMPTNVEVLPKHIQIIGGSFIIHWKYTCHPVVIDIPGLSDPLPDLKDGVTELSIDDLPMESTEAMNMEDPNKLYAKQKVKEAVLKAKVAYYKAQNKIRSFSDKYGDEYSGSDLEDTENDSEYPSESESESEVDE
jgi:hypothetical protein